MPVLELIDETLDINSTENYELSVELSPDNLSFIILDTIRNKFIMLRSSRSGNDKKYTAVDLGELIRTDEFLTKKYKKINIIAPSGKFTLVPSPLYESERKDEYFLFNHSLPENHIILVNKLKDPDSYLLYSQPDSLNELICKTWPDLQTYHHLGPLLTHVSETSNDHDDYLHIHAEKEFFNLIVYSKGKFKLCNSFIYKDISDIIYYTLNIIKNEDLKKECIIVLRGQLEKRDELHSGLSAYMRNIKFATPGGSFTFSYVMNETDLFRYINLISAVNCG